jgi:hypothetical protein
MANFLNSTLTSIARWYRSADRLKPGQVAEQAGRTWIGATRAATTPQFRIEAIIWYDGKPRSALVKRQVMMGLRRSTRTTSRYLP